MYIRQDLWPEFKRYLLIDKKLSAKDASVLPNKSRFRQISKWFCNHEFDRDNVGIFLDRMAENKNKYTYMNKMITLLKHLDKFRKVNQIQDYSYFPESYSPVDILIPDEIKSLANVQVPYKKNCEYLNRRQKLLIMLLGTTGSRIGEVLNLKWSDIGNAATYSYVLYRETKNGDPRTVPIDIDLCNEILQLPRSGEYIFTSYRGKGSKPLGYQEVNLDLKRRAKLVGIKKNIHTHVFRHSFVTTMLEADVDSTDIGKLIGHRNANSILRYKNSLVTYYAQVAQLHPLLRETWTLEQVSQRLRPYVEKIVDTKNFKLAYSQDSGKIIFSIEDFTSGITSENPITPTRLDFPPHSDNIATMIPIDNKSISVGIWEQSMGTDVVEIDQRDHLYWKEFSKRLDRRHPEVAAGFNQVRMAEVLGISTLPPQIQEVWHSAFEVSTPDDYDNFMERAQALNPYLKNPDFTVGQNVGKLRTIGWSFTALDKARVVALAKVINKHPEKDRFLVHRGDIGGKYWEERTYWSVWTDHEFRDKKLEKEEVLRGWLNPDWGNGGDCFAEIIGYDYIGRKDLL